MDGFSILDPLAWRPDCFKLHPAYSAGNAVAWLSKTGAATSTNHYLAGRLYVSKSGWLLLSVPNALVRGVFDAMNTPGVELPLAGAMNVPAVKPELLNAHISVMTADEVSSIGANKINERGHTFRYALGPVKEITPKNIDGISRVWAIQVASPELAALRKSYGLSPLPKDDHPFHITVAVRRANVLRENSVSKFDAAPSRGELKAAADKTVTYDCGCSGPCQCPETCVCKQNGTCRATAKTAQELPWRERAEVYARDPATGKLYGGKWDNDGSFALPGGGIDPGEDPAQAALRELKEETGITATNPRVLPVPPVDSPWSDKTRAEKAKQGRGNFAGSRTHFVAADVVKHPKRKNLDYWAATDRGYYDPAEALAIMQAVKKFNVPSIANARMAAINALIAETAKKQASVKDVLHGGQADNTPDKKFDPKTLAEGVTHEHEHTNDDQIAKEIAKDHLQEDPAYYEKVEQVEKSSDSTLAALLEAKEHSDNKRYAHKNEILRRLMAEAPEDWVIDSTLRNMRGVTHVPTKFKLHTHPTVIPPSVKAAVDSVYGNQALNLLNFRTPIEYDHGKPVFENIKNQLHKVKERGDFVLQSRRNYDQWRSHLDPNYRYQLAVAHFRGQMPQPSLWDQIIERYGDGMIASLPNSWRR